MTDPHRIAAEQNKPERIELLRAQRLFYGRAKFYQNSFALCALLLPVAGVIFGGIYPAIGPFLGLGSILVLLLEVGVISYMQSQDSRRGAKLQEQFDTEVLKLDWNRWVAGSKVDAEDIRAITSRPLLEAERKRLLDWYEPDVSSLPLEVGRLICQRTNVTYDMRIRKRYSGILLGSVTVLVILLTAAGLLQGLTANDLILVLYLPALPIVAFVLREHGKQKNTIETLVTLKSEVDQLWEKALSGVSFDVLTAGSRALQDSIFRHRANNPLMFDWLYDCLRIENEDITHHATEKLVAEAQQYLTSRDSNET